MQLTANRIERIKKRMIGWNDGKYNQEFVARNWKNKEYSLKF